GAAPHELVEEELRVAVDVERPLAGALLAVFGSAAVYGGRGGVEERHFLLLAPLEEPPRVRVVVLHHEAAVALHGVRAGALVQQRLDRSFPALEIRDELR